MLFVYMFLNFIRFDNYLWKERVINLFFRKNFFLIILIKTFLKIKVKINNGKLLGANKNDNSHAYKY